MALLGYYVSLNHESTDHQYLTEQLSRKLSASLEAFYEELEHSCGRYVCFYEYNGSMYALNDCCGMKAIYYTTKPIPFIASHTSMLKQVTDVSPDPHCGAFLSDAAPQQYNMTFLPGFHTLFRNIQLLCPNTCIDLNNANICRYFPRKELQRISTEHAVNRTTEFFTDLASKLSRISPLAASLTAGLDTRLTLAATRSIRNDIEYFTYIRNKDRVNYIDGEIALRLTEKHNLRHSVTFFNYENTERTPAYNRFEEIARHNNPYEHFYPLAFSYLQSYPAERLHLRSNIGEICRARYYNRPFDKILDANQSRLSRLVKIFNTWTKSKEHLHTYKAVEDYINTTDLYVTHEKYGYDILMLYYWEHLMGTWHASLLLESDMSHDTVCLFNNRAILTSFLGIPFEDQVSAKAMRDVITRLWPDILDEPINPKIHDISLDTLTSRQYNIDAL
ncbi:MAG: hypothetical protein JXR49_23580 [Acidobacteria bacterium]|nr:hypothetical protein [Acidobacteriota bacterium]